MNNELLIGLMALIGTLSGTFGGIITSTKLTNFRLQQLENKVDVHNNFAYEIPIIKEQIKNITDKLDEIERND